MAELRSKRKKEELPQRPTDRLKSFTERSEEELIKSLLKKTDQSNEDIEELMNIIRRQIIFEMLF